MAKANFSSLQEEKLINTADQWSSIHDIQISNMENINYVANTNTRMY